MKKRIKKPLSKKNVLLEKENILKMKREIKRILQII
jgi:hypothetical protein